MVELVTHPGKLKVGCYIRPKLWHGLPVEIWDANSLNISKMRIKRYLKGKHMWTQIQGNPPPFMPRPSYKSNNSLWTRAIFSPWNHCSTQLQFALEWECTCLIIRLTEILLTECFPKTGRFSPLPQRCHLPLAISPCTCSCFCSPLQPIIICTVYVLVAMDMLTWSKLLGSHIGKLC